MSELTNEDITQLRSALLLLRQELAALLESSKEAARPVDLDQPIGRVSRMDAMQEQKMIAANRSAAMIRQRQVDAAIERMDEDEYGDCVECGEAIGYRRLEAHPEAPFCIVCQRARENSA